MKLSKHEIVIAAWDFLRNVAIAWETDYRIVFEDLEL